MTNWLGKLMGVKGLQSISDVKVRFAAPWAQDRPVLVLFIAAALAAVGLVFYFRYQRSSGEAETGGLPRTALAIARSALLALIVVILAEPTISMTGSEQTQPLLVWLFDGSDSFNLKDPLTGDELAELSKVTQDKQGKVDDGLEDASRLDLVRKVVARSDDLYLGEKSDQLHVRAYIMDQPDQVREIPLESGGGGVIDAAKLAERLEASGEVSALGTAIEDLARRHQRHTLAGVVVVSDFDRNAGAAPVPAAKKLGVPFYTVGIGPRKVIDLSVGLRAPQVLKKDEDTTVKVELRQDGLTGKAVRVQLLARRLGTAGGASAETTAKEVSPPQTIELNDSRRTFDMPFTPDEAGRFMLQVKVDPLDGEALEENNVAQREITVTDKSLKLFFVEYEPTWEWRFVKEVFHRDPLIGYEGFRTYLRSADIKVRKSNDLFVEALTLPRSEFFANDVIFLSDVPAEMLSDNFQDMLQEYVRDFGGGLVVIGGSRFTASLARTKIGDMLPVVLDESLRTRNGKFHMQFTPEAREFDFVNLGDSEQENNQAWENLDPLGWYQPVVRKRPQATVLANIPAEKCADDVTPQIVMAIGPYGKGQVVYLGVNEFWRLRRKYGERYYRQFWGQLIYRLGLGRALGAQKRFQVYADRQNYQVGDAVRVTVEAQDENFNPLEAAELSARLISGPTASGGGGDVQDFTLPAAGDKAVFEATVPVYSPGAHRVLVRDPVTDEEYEIDFTVAPLAVERRNATRNFALQEALADQTDGKTYELYQLASLAGDLTVPRVVETTEHRFPLWNTWLVLLLVVVLMLGEWLGRKLVNLR